jgi:hypothetical protein
MNETNNSVAFDGWLFSVNTNAFPRDELAKYSGRFIAWSMDGRCILASGENNEEVDRNLRVNGIDPSQVIHDYVEPLDGSSLS